MEIVGYVVIWLVSIVGGLIWQGYVLTILWGWFIVRVFSVRQINIPEAIGISLTIAFLQRIRWKRDKGSMAEQTAKLFATTLLGPLFVLGFGAIIKLWL